MPGPGNPSSSVRLADRIDRKPPRVLFKYRDKNSQGARELFLDRRIWLSRPAEFNDPFDGAPTLRRPTEDETRAFVDENVGPWAEDERRAPREVRARMKEAFAEPGFWEHTHDHMRSEVGIYSMSATPTSLLAWAHYSCGHRGYCVKLNTSALYASKRVAVLPVTYSQHRPESSPLPSPDFEEHVEAYHLTKSEEWAYEEEIRVVSLELTGMVQCAPHLVAGVILGARMPLDDQRTIVGLLAKGRRRRNRPTVERAVLVDGAFAVAIEPVGRDELTRIVGGRDASRLLRA